MSETTINTNDRFAPETSETYDEALGAALNARPLLWQVWVAMEERPTFATFVRIVGAQMSAWTDADFETDLLELALLDLRDERGSSETPF